MSSTGLLITIGAICIFFIAGYRAYSVYKSRFASRDFDDSREMLFMAQAKSQIQATQANPAPVQPSAQNTAPHKPEPTPVAEPSANKLAALRPALLDTAARLAYLSLKLELADYEVLTQVDSATLFEVPPAARISLDFVICHKRSFIPVSIIMMQRSGEKTPAQKAVLTELTELGLRIVPWPANAPLPREKIRAHVLGA